MRIFLQNHMELFWWGRRSRPTYILKVRASSALAGASMLMDRSNLKQDTKAGNRKIKVYKNKRKNLTKAEKMLPELADWPSIFSTARSFNPAIVPLPIRMGRIRPNKLGDIPPAAQGNIEILKIPNFLHLTPPAIRQHCEALKPLCTEWPPTLKEKPLRITSNNYIYSGPSIRHPESKKVTLRVYLYDLELDQHAKTKIILLAGPDRYCSNTDELSITVDKCPTRNQNRQYAMYLLTALYQEAWKTEKWENEKPTDQSIKQLQRSIADLLKLKTEQEDRNKKIGNQTRTIAGKVVRFNRRGKAFIVENDKYGIYGPPSRNERTLFEDEWQKIKP